MAKDFKLLKSSSSHGNELHKIMEPLLSERMESVLQISEKRSHSREEEISSSVVRIKGMVEADAAR